MISAMPVVALITGGLLVVVGLVGYFATGMASWTALIPAILGLFFLACGGLAKWKDSLRKHLMHAAAGLSLIGLFGTRKGFFNSFALMQGAEMERAEAVIAQAVTFIILAVFLGLCIRSFIAARRAAKVG